MFFSQTILGVMFVLFFLKFTEYALIISKENLFRVGLMLFSEYSSLIVSNYKFASDELIR